MAEYESKKAGRERYKIGSGESGPLEVYHGSKTSDKQLGKFADALEYKFGSNDENIADRIINDLMDVSVEKKAEETKEEEKESEDEVNKEEFKKAGQILALDALNKAVYGKGITVGDLQKEAKGKYSKTYPETKTRPKRIGEAGKITRSYKRLFGPPLKAITYPLRRPAATLAGLAAAAGGLYGYGRYRRKQLKDLEQI